MYLCEKMPFLKISCHRKNLSSDIKLLLRNVECVTLCALQFVARKKSLQCDDADMNKMHLFWGMELKEGVQLLSINSSIVEVAVGNCKFQYWWPDVFVVKNDLCNLNSLPFQVNIFNCPQSFGWFRSKMQTQQLFIFSSVSAD